MKILIELPTWLGDATMVTPAIENLVNFFNTSEVTLIGSFISIDLLKNHPKVIKTYVLDKNYINLYKTLKKLHKFDLFLSFRSSYRTKFINFFISSKFNYQYNKNKYVEGHQVEKYNHFVNDSLKTNFNADKLKLYIQESKIYTKSKIIGINPGASYGSSKRWYPKEFADVAFDLSNKYDIIIFGGPKEKDIAEEIEKNLIKKGVTNYQNLAAQTSISDLISQIANLDLFITADSGPMHLAAALKIPTISIFGPTNDKETSQWLNEKSVIVKKKLDCQPCMKRTCPLNHHNCMKLIRAPEVLDVIKDMLD
jgi:heptosyltransferase II